jgi:uncharacterized protein YcfJ
MSISTKKILMGFIAAGFTLGSTTASAQDNHDQRYDGRYEDTDSMYDYARVVDVQPLTTRVRVSTPQRECRDEMHHEGGGYAPGPQGPQVAGYTILGAAIGAVLGHQVGSGRGQDAATIGGAIVGAGLGHRQGMRRYGERLPVRAYTVQRCETRYQDEWQERVDAYRVTYDYQGRRQVTELPYRPGERIRVRVAVTPAEQ